MVKFHNPGGSVSLTNELFENIVGDAVRECYGVVGTVPTDAADGILSAVLEGRDTRRGVTVTVRDNRLAISVHVRVLYGLNLLTVRDNVREKIVWAVESATGLKVRKTDIFVDDIVTE